ncbi:hypothetical protein QX204_01240 [Nocardia sp. PE-7]|uniref:hypothetical protein n=1 Tax=Nocardia sp. PE-7 TaxID=3058426 RepID=UPI002659E76A|nr:hypothetical protein [Nocardia sp. PE-7]WKG10162.1 hypothetical protein QX204_01240 [Nocardia sp. PE-7]
MNPIARLEAIADQHASAVKRIQDRFEQIDQRAKSTSRELAIQERQRRRVTHDRHPETRKQTPGTLTPSDLLGHPDLLVWALRK